MATEGGSVPEVWSLRALTLALGFAYTPFFIPARSMLAHMLSVVHELGRLWWLGLIVLASSGAVLSSFLALTVGVRWLIPPLRKKLSLFLLAAWFPHNVLFWLWGLLTFSAPD